MSALPPKTPVTVAPFSDALGYRVLGFDKKSGDRLEMLRLRPQLASSPVFESAVRERQRRLGEFRHLAFARVRQIDRPQGQAAALAIVSNYADGRRLSEVLRAAEAAGAKVDLITAVCLLRQVVAATARLHELESDLSHGTLNPERLVVTPAGRIVLTEYVVGAGLGALGLTPQQAWQEYRVALPVGGGGSFDQTADVFQLGYLGLTLVSGRSIYDRQFPPPFATLVGAAEEITLDGRNQTLHPAIVGWLSRALGVEGEPFPAAVEAQTSLDEAIASAGLVATPDVVVDLLSRCDAQPDVEATAIVEGAALGAPPAPALDPAIITSGSPAAAGGTFVAPVSGLGSPAFTAPSSSGSRFPAAQDPGPASASEASSNGSGERASAWTPPAEPAPELPPFPRRDHSAPHHSAVDATAPIESRLTPSGVRAVQSAETAVMTEVASYAPAGTAGAPPEPEFDLPMQPPVEAAAPPPAAHDSDLPASRAWTPKPAVERPAASRSHGTLFSRTADAADAPVVAAAAVAVRRPYFVALGMAVVMVAIFEVVMRMFNPFLATPAKASTAELSDAAHGTLSIDATPQARVFIDEAPRGTTPVRLDLPAGAHRVRLEADGHGRAFQVNVIAGKEISQLVELARGGQLGTIDVKSDPAGARVTIDGRAVGVSPVSVHDLKPGTHAVVLEGPNGSIRQVVQVNAGATSSILVPLAAAAAAAAAAAPATTTGYVSIDSPEELQVLVSGRLIGTSRTARLALEAGTHDVELRSDAAGFSATRSVQVQSGKVARVSVQLPDGSLSLNALPWAEVWLDGTRIGETPVGNVTARAGTHELIFRHPDLGEIRQTVIVKAGEIGRVTVNMTK